MREFTYKLKKIKCFSYLNKYWKRFFKLIAMEMILIKIECLNNMKLLILKYNYQMTFKLY